MLNTIQCLESDHLCTLLREARVKARATQQEVSKRLGRGQSFLSDIERGKRRLDTLELRSLCIVLGVDWKTFSSSWKPALGGRLDALHNTCRPAHCAAFMFFELTGYQARY